MGNGADILHDDSLIDNSNDDVFGKKIAIAVLVAFQGLFWSGAFILVSKIV